MKSSEASRTHTIATFIRVDQSRYERANQRLMGHKQGYLIMFAGFVNKLKGRRDFQAFRLLPALRLSTAQLQRFLQP